MKTKTLLLVAALLVAGMIPAGAQSNPNSTNATDVEMQLAWPDGTVYAGSIYSQDSGYVSNSGYSWSDYVNWTETTGGTLDLSEIQENPYNNSDYSVSLLAEIWPEL